MEPYSQSDSTVLPQKPLRPLWSTRGGGVGAQLLEGCSQQKHHLSLASFCYRFHIQAALAPQMLLIRESFLSASLISCFPACGYTFTRLQTFPHTRREHEARRMKEMIFSPALHLCLRASEIIRGNARRERWEKEIAWPLWIRWHWKASLSQLNGSLSDTSQEGTGWTPKIRWSSQQESITVKITGAFEKPKDTMVTEAFESQPSSRKGRRIQVSLGMYLQRTCYGLNECLSPRLANWNIDPQCGATQRWTFRWLGRER